MIVLQQLLLHPGEPPHAWMHTRSRGCSNLLHGTFHNSLQCAWASQLCRQVATRACSRVGVHGLGIGFHSRLPAAEQRPWEIIRQLLEDEVMGSGLMVKG